MSKNMIENQAIIEEWFITLISYIIILIPVYYFFYLAYFFLRDLYLFLYSFSSVFKKCW